jgi:hypothetical protein
MLSLAMGKIMRNEFTFEFSGMEILPGYDVYASGQADIAYRLVRPQPDVGIMRKHVLIEVLSIVLDATPYDAPNLNLSQDHPLYDLIVVALVNNDDVFSACIEDSENV